MDFRLILKESRDGRGRNIFEIFRSGDLSFLEIEWSICDKNKRATWRQDSSASASDGWRRGPGTAVGAQLKKSDECRRRLFGMFRTKQSGYGRGGTIAEATTILRSL